MRRLSFIAIFLLIQTLLFAQSPHGEDLGIKCALCHNTNSWKIDYETIKYDHSSTSFELEGEHTKAECTDCHSSLEFKEAPPPSNCVSCHNDMHSMTVGDDCARCHTAQSWLVDHIPELHEENGFPLIGVHDNISCNECHKSETNLRFDRLGNDCINCHREDYNSTQTPNHVALNYSTDCLECHDPLSGDWRFDARNHAFFPLTLGHNINDCSRCHEPGSYSGLDPDCAKCHQNDFNNTINPKHSDAGFSTDCASCHTTNPGWKPTNYDHGFFPLTNAHAGHQCAVCHKDGNYLNTSSDCSSCHETDYDNSDNPKHKEAGFSTNCLECHNTIAWSPSSYDHSMFPLTWGHDIRDCKKCHITDNFSDATPDCVSCHQNNYDATTKPKHSGAGFSTNCTQCHTTKGWTPSTFDHDGQYFPIYSGKHQGEWNNCTDCHTNPDNYMEFSCLGCHSRGETDGDHDEVRDYQYNSAACFKCHPDGEE